jgi:hypothetical protein
MDKNIGREKGEKVTKKPTNNGTNIPILERTVVPTVSSCEASLFRQARTPLGNPDKEYVALWNPMAHNPLIHCYDKIISILKRGRSKRVAIAWKKFADDNIVNMRPSHECQLFIDILVCPKHKQHPEVVIKTDGAITFRCCCAEFRIQCFYMFNKLLAGYSMNEAVVYWKKVNRI